MGFVLYYSYDEADHLKSVIVKYFKTIVVLLVSLWCGYSGPASQEAVSAVAEASALLPSCLTIQPEGTSRQ